MKHIEFPHRNENQGVHVEFSVRRPSPPNTYSYVQEKNSWIQQKILTKLAFPPQQKTDTTAQLYCTLSTYVTPKTISRQNPKN